MKAPSPKTCLFCRKEILYNEERSFFVCEHHNAGVAYDRAGSWSEVWCDTLRVQWRSLIPDVYYRNRITTTGYILPYFYYDLDQGKIEDLSKYLQKLTLL